MEKLIELLDIYEEQIVGVHSVGDKINDKETSWIISKKFGFIKRLVDNDKIDYEEYADEWRDSNVANNAAFFGLSMHYNVYESLLMVLAIQDNPIEFLISILR